VKPYAEQMPLFARYQVEGYLASMFNPVVQLPSGGYIVIGVTEALVAIDVNSGRATKEGSIEQTALKTNLEAADEVARQLRLRDLAGLIVVDFIDMDERKNNAAVEKRFKDKLKTDRARIQVGRISGFGLLEMSRQRLRPGMLEATTQPCPHCHGTGLLRSDESVALSILRQLEEEGIRGRSREVLLKVPVGIMNFLMNFKREHIAGIERRYTMAVRIEGDLSLVSPDFTLEKFKTATRALPEITAPVITSANAAIEDEDLVEEEIEEDEEEAEAETAEATTPRAEAEGDDKPRKKRRRRRRRRGGAADGDNGAQAGATGDDADGAEDDADDAAEDSAEPAAPAVEEEPRRRTRVRSRRTTDKATPAADAPAVTEAVAEAEAEVAPSTEEAAAAPVEVEAEAEPAKPAPAKRRSRARKADVAEAEAAPAAETPAAEPAPAPEAPARKPRTRRTKAAAAAPAEEAPAAEAAPVTEAPAPEAEVEAAPAAEAPTPAPAAPEPAPEPVPETTEAAAPEAEAEAPAAPEAERDPNRPRRKGWWSLGR
jgi:ribonuclease E